MTNSSPGRSAQRCDCPWGNHLDEKTLNPHMRPYDLRTCELGHALAAQPTAATDYPHELIPKFFELSRTVQRSRGPRVEVCVRMLDKLPRRERWLQVR